MIVSTMVIRWLLRMRTMSAVIVAADNANVVGGNDNTGNGESETAVDSMNDNTNIVGHCDSDFSEGLSRMLIGMCASISKTVCSTTMAHLIVRNEGSRFQFLHEFTHLFVHPSYHGRCPGSAAHGSRSRICR